MTAGISLPPRIAAELLAHARRELPNEACGLLAGDTASGRVSRYHPARNARTSPTAFEVHPEDLARIVIGIEDGGEDLVAIFHSHPRGPARPSATDLREASYPVVYLIADLGPRADRPLRGWRIERGRAREVSIGGPADQQPSNDSSSTRPSRASISTSAEHDPSSPPER